MLVNIHFFEVPYLETLAVVSKKKTSLKTTLHVHRAFLYISLSSLHDYDMKVPLGGGRKHNTATFVFFSRTSIQSVDEVNEMKKAR